MKAIVVDASVLVAALLADGRARRTLIHATDRLVVPARILEETRGLLPALSRKSGLPEALLRVVFDDVLPLLTVVPMPLFEGQLSRARDLARRAHAEGDEHYIALALAMNAPIWTYDHDFQRVPGIQTVGTTDIRTTIAPAGRR